MKKFKIAIEETIVEEFEVEANNFSHALEIAEKNYKTGKFVLESGECQFRKMAVVQPTSESTDWIEI